MYAGVIECECVCVRMWVCMQVIILTEVSIHLERRKKSVTDGRKDKKENTDGEENIRWIDNLNTHTYTQLSR